MSWRWRWAQHHLGALISDSGLRVLGMALVCAVAASSAVQLFSDRVALALASQSGETLGADLIVSSRQALPDEFQAQLDSLALQQSLTIHLPSVVWFGNSSHLAGLKAVAENYPLKGQLRTASAPLVDEKSQMGIPAAGEAWVDAQLWSALQLQRDAMIEVGAARLQVSQLLSYEPDRGSGFADIAPRIMINLLDLPKTQLLQPGSRAQYRLLLAGEANVLAQAQQIDFPAGTKAITPADARPEIRSALNRAHAFLALAGMTASLLGAVAVALCAHQYGQRLRADVALLRCLGAQRKDVVGALLLSLSAMALVAGGLGAALGWLAQTLLQDLAALFLMPSLPAAHPSTLLQAWLIALVLLLGFALPPLLQATNTAPTQIFRGENSATKNSFLWQFFALAGVVVLLRLQAPSWDMLGWVLLGQALTAGLLALLGYTLIWSLRSLREGSMSGWRLGVGNLLRHRALSLAQIMALGLGLLALLLLTVVRHDLLQGWQNKLPANTPNQFLINIQNDQVAPLRAYLQEQRIQAERIWPMARSRLVAINGLSINADSFEDPETQRWINRDFNLSWTDRLGPDNKLLEGPWWGDSGHGQALISADDYARERLQLKLGDRLSLNFAGEVIEFTVHNFREVDWDSFQPNFFLLTPPGVLDHVPATWLTSFYLPPKQRAALRHLSQKFPNVTVLDLEALMNQVRAIMQRIVEALELVFLFTVAAGLIVLLAAMETGRDQRAREIALMRSLGASRNAVRNSLLAEFATLGGLSGAIAAACAQALGWILATQIFDIPYQLRWESVLISSLGGALLVCGLAWLSLRRVTHTPPDHILRQ